MPSDTTTLTAAPEPNALAAINPESIIVTALERGVSVETMERLLTMRADLRKEQARASFLSALAAFQCECPVIVKDKDVMNKDGRTVRYRYAPMESILRQVSGLLAKHGFSYSFNTESENDAVLVHCTAAHRDGHTETTKFHSNIDPQAFMNLAQKFGSALTFAKRYAFCNAFGIITGDEDDDAQSVTETKGAASARAKLEALNAAKRRAAQGPPDAPLYHESDENAPEAPETAFNTFLEGLTVCEDSDALAAFVPQANAFTGAVKQAARKAIQDRADWLGLKWDAGIKTFIKPRK